MRKERKIKVERSLKKEAFKQDEKNVADTSSKNVVLISHPTLSKTLIEKIVE